MFTISLKKYKIQKIADYLEWTKIGNCKKDVSKTH